MEKFKQTIIPPIRNFYWVFINAYSKKKIILSIIYNIVTEKLYKIILLKTCLIVNNSVEKL